jgi:hypothetical protein
MNMKETKHNITYVIKQEDEEMLKALLCHVMCIEQHFIFDEDIQKMQKSAASTRAR